jgi:hypothetical protein
MVRYKRRVADVGISALFPSRPGEFHPEPLTDPDLILSHHPASRPWQLIRFRRSRSSSLALASPDRACRDHRRDVSATLTTTTFCPQQLAVAWDRRPDHRTRRALLHLQYSCASPCGPAILVTQDPIRNSGPVRSAEIPSRNKPASATVGRSISVESETCAIRLCLLSELIRNLEETR